jgi:hypothetical protein
MIKGVMITDICTINAVFELLVLFKASMQKILLNIERPLIPIPIMAVRLSIVLIRRGNIIMSAARPPIEKVKSIVKYGRYPSSILDHMYEEPHKIALIAIKAGALPFLMMFIFSPTFFPNSILFKLFTIFIV